MHSQERAWEEDLIEKEGDRSHGGQKTRIEEDTRIEVNWG